MLAYVPEFPGLGVEELEGVDLDYHLETRHLLGIEALIYHVIDEEHLRLRMIHKIMYVSRLELVEYRNRHCAVGERRKETHAPVRLVLRAYGNLVTLAQPALLEADVELLYPACHIPVEKGHALIVRQCRAVPVLPDALLECLVD